MPILKVAKVESEFNISCWKLLSCQNAKLSNCQFAKLPSCQIAKLPSCQVAKLQVAKLWTCDHGAKSLSFLFYFVINQNTVVVQPLWKNSNGLQKGGSKYTSHCL